MSRNRNEIKLWDKLKEKIKQIKKTMRLLILEWQGRDGLEKKIEWIEKYFFLNQYKNFWNKWAYFN